MRYSLMCHYQGQMSSISAPRSAEASDARMPLDPLGPDSLASRSWVGSHNASAVAPGIPAAFGSKVALWRRRSPSDLRHG